MRQWIARMVIVALVMNAVPVYAQDAEPVVNKVQGCEKPAGLDTGYWNGLMSWQQKAQCDQQKWLQGGPAPTASQAMTYDTGQRVSPKLMVAGGVTAVVGVAVMLGGGTDVSVLGDTYCVSDYAVDSGSCSTPMGRKVGAIMLGSGLLMAWVGSRRKHVKLSVGPKAASATIAWGGK
jgi:hypothetical protein